MSKKGKLKPSEAVFGFAAWLTTREQPITMGSSNDCAPVAELVGRFNKTNKLEDPKDKWADNLKFPNKKTKR